MSVTHTHKKHRAILQEQAHKRAIRLQKRRRQADIVSTANNIKWQKILEALETQLGRSCDATIKLLLEDESFVYRDFLSSLFEDTYLEGTSGVLRYGEIEWIELPCQHNVQFNFDVELERKIDSLVVYGYRRIVA